MGIYLRRRTGKLFVVIATRKQKEDAHHRKRKKGEYTHDHHRERKKGGYTHEDHRKIKTVFIKRAKPF